MENNLASVKRRILLIADIKRVSKEDFCSSIGQTYGNYKGKNLDTAVSSDVLANILSMYPDVNIDFILTGTGDPIRRIEATGGHSLSIGGDNHGVNLFASSIEEQTIAQHAGDDRLIEALKSEIAHLRALVNQRDEQMLDLVKNLVGKSGI